MRKILTITLAIVAFAMISSTAQAVTYSGSIMTPDGIIGSGPWGESFKVAWEISDNPAGQPTGSWLYQYWITDQYGQELGKEVSHFIIAISPNATSEDFWGNPYLEVGTFSGADPSNPGMPGSLYGLKVETGTSKTVKTTARMCTLTMPTLAIPIRPIPRRMACCSMLPARRSTRFCAPIQRRPWFLSRLR
jgi:hypothetical protein